MVEEPDCGARLLRDGLRCAGSVHARYGLLAYSQFEELKETSMKSKAIGTIALACSLLAHAEAVRSKREIQKFKDQTGYHEGRHGYVVDHIIPLCVCQHDQSCLAALDLTANMQWQSEIEAKPKNAREFAACATVRAKIKAASAR